MILLPKWDTTLGVPAILTMILQITLAPMIPVRGIGDLFDDPGEMLMLQLLHFSGQGLRRIACFYQYPRLKNGLTMII